MDEIKILPEHADKYVAFGKTAKVLGERSQEDLVELAMYAQSSQDPSLLELFDGELPSLDELNDAFVENQKKVAAKSQLTRKPAAQNAQPASQNRSASTGLSANETNES